MDEEPVVRLDQVRRTYRTGNTVTVALDGITVGFARGAFVAVMGVPVLDAEPTSAAVLWRPDAPRDLMTRLVAEVRKATGWTGPDHPVA